MALVKKLDQLENPLDLTELVILFIIGLQSIEEPQKNLVQAIIQYELEEPYNTPIRAFDSDTRLKLLFINAINSYNFKSAYIHLDALGWDEWRFPDVTNLFQKMDLKAWLYFYRSLREFAIDLEWINENDYMTPEELLEQLSEHIIDLFENENG